MIEPLGDRAVALQGVDDPLALTAALAPVLPHCVIRGGMSSVLVEDVKPSPDLIARVTDALAHLSDSGSVIGSVEERTEHRLPVAYDGVDLPDVARDLRISIDQVIAAHQEQVWRVAMLGFAPGFGYLVPAGEPIVEWTKVTRRASARPRVEAGSVAVAAGMSAVYPESMPGGWNLLGRCAISMFDPINTQPSLLAPGDLVRFAALADGESS